MKRDDDGVQYEKKWLDSPRVVSGTPESFGALSLRMNGKTIYWAIEKKKD